MENEILQKVSQDMIRVDLELTKAKDLIKALKEAGENVTELEKQIKDLERRRTKWQNMLAARGL